MKQKQIAQILEYLNSRKFSQQELEELLDKNKKSGLILSENRKKRYSFEVLTTHTNESSGYEKRWGRYEKDKRFSSIFLDTPVGISLMYKGIPNTLISLMLSHKDSLMIFQLQGVVIFDDIISRNVISHSRGLIVLDWQKLMIELTEKIARELNLREIGILSGQNNYWLNKQYPDGKTRLTLEQALKKYDKTAERLGFRQREDNNWYKKVNNYISFLK